MFNSSVTKTAQARAQVYYLNCKAAAPKTTMPEEDRKELNRLRREGFHDREDTHEERNKIQIRRKEIEQRRLVLSLHENSAHIKELLALQLEVVNLQEKIVELQLVSNQQQELFTTLKASANGIWHELSMNLEESQVRREAIQAFAEAIQKLNEDVQKHKEDFEHKQRAKKAVP
ncbi:MAG: hypothetical protein C0469_00445 [Cyanobacteria bacterium DS2.3.42]|nr:hypothetical protein [Cyanobacteria bacterium DS2.3.42]